MQFFGIYIKNLKSSNSKDTPHIPPPRRTQHFEKMLQHHHTIELMRKPMYRNYAIDPSEKKNDTGIDTTNKTQFSLFTYIKKIKYTKKPISYSLPFQMPYTYPTKSTTTT